MIKAVSDSEAMDLREFRHVEGEDPSHSNTQHETTPRRKKRRPLLILVILGCFCNLMAGSWIFFSLNVVYAEVVRIFGVSRSHASILFTVFFLVRTLHGLANKELFQRFGLPVCLMAGSIICSLSFIGAAFTSGIAMFIACVGGGVASGTSLLFVGSMVAPQRFRLSKTKTSLVTVLFTAALGIADMTGSIIMEYLIHHLGYRSAMLVFAGAFAQLCVFNMAFWSLLHSEQSSLETSTNTTWRQQIRYLLKNGAYLVFLLGEFIKSLTALTYRNTQVDNIISIGFSIQTGAFFALLYGASAFVGRILNGALLTVKKWHGAYHYSLLNILFGGCVLAAAFMTSYYEQLIINSSLGAFAGGLSDFNFLFLHEIVTPEAYLLAVIVNHSATASATMIMAPYAGWIRDTTGSYNAFYYSALPMCGFTAIIVSGYHFWQSSRMKKSFRVGPTEEQHVYSLS